MAHPFHPHALPAHQRAMHDRAEGSRRLSRCGVQGRARAGFTLIDLLVSLAVMALIIGLMLPAVSEVREASRRVVCASNLRQVGLGVTMYADEQGGSIPPTVFSSGLSTTAGRDYLNETVVLRTDEDRKQVRMWGRWGEWDGLGLLYSEHVLNAPGVFYCPSHPGDETLSAYASRWGGEEGRIVGNYQYRGRGPSGETKLYQFDPRAPLTTDSLRIVDEFNHDTGLNVMSAGISVAWVQRQVQTVGSTPGGALAATAGKPPPGVSDVWRTLEKWLTSGSGGMTSGATPNQPVGN